MIGNPVAVLILLAMFVCAHVQGFEQPYENELITESSRAKRGCGAPGDSELSREGKTIFFNIVYF